MPFGYTELLLQAASASKSRKVPPARELGRAETRVPPFPRAEERKAGAAVSLEGSESKARALSAGDGTLGTRWRCRTESRSLSGPGDRKTRHRILTFEPVAGSARWRQPLVPDIKTSGAFPREGGAKARNRTASVRPRGGSPGSGPRELVSGARASRRREGGRGRGLAARLRTSGRRRRWCARLSTRLLAGLGGYGGVVGFSVFFFFFSFRPQGLGFWP